MKKKIGIIDLDTKRKSHIFPNIACMKIYAYHEQQGDEIIYPYHGEKVDILYISIIFSASKPMAEKLIHRYKHVAEEIVVGGSGWDYSPHAILPNEVERCSPAYHMYDIPYGIGFTFRGCHVGCGFCIVWRKEGLKEYRVNTIEDLMNLKSNHIVLLNNNSFANKNGFLEDAEKIKKYNLTVNYNQANDITLLDDEIAEILAGLEFRNFSGKGKQLHFAFDSMVKQKVINKKKIQYDMRKTIPEKVKMLQYYGIKPRQLTFYMLIGFDTTMEQDLERVELLKSLGCEPYAMVYRNLEGMPNVDKHLNPQSPHVRYMARWVNTYLYRNTPFHAYQNWVNYQNKEKGIQGTYNLFQQVREQYHQLSFW